MKKRINSLFGGQRGISLPETLVALGILGVIGVAFLTALSTGSLSTATLDEQVTAESLARTQLEEIKKSPYDATEPIEYSPIDSLPPGYAVAVDAQFKDGYTTIQEVTVTISREGEPLLKVTDYKVNR